MTTTIPTWAVVLLTLCNIGTIIFTVLMVRILRRLDK